MYEVCPFGERRQDIRSGYHSAQIVAANFKDIETEDFSEMVRQFCDYLPCDQDTEETADMDALALMKRSQ